MNKKIGKIEVEKFKEMEEQILSLSAENNGVSYARDLRIEAKIKYSILCEKFTRKIVDLFIAEENIRIESLADQDKYVEISKRIANI